MSAADGETREVLTPDICVVGGGSGGLSVAAGAAAFGVRVVLVERGRMGGDCLNYGCVPSKALIAAARHAQAIREAPAFGVSAGGVRVDMRRVREHIRSVIASIAPNDSVERFEKLGVRVVRAEARFRDPRTIAAGGISIRPRRFVLATGSSPRIPSIPGIDGVPFLTNETVFDLDGLPSRLLVLGGGPIGLELAHAFRRLGSEVVVIESERPLAKEDAELAAVVLHRIEAEGVEILAGTKVLGVARDAGNALALDVEEAGGRRRVIRGSHLLLAAGRRPNLGALDLDAAGIAHDERGIRVDAGLRTIGNRRAFAIGDIAGGMQFTHLANEQAGLVLRRILFRLPARFDATTVPRVVFTDPPLGQVGMTEAEARAAGLSVETATFPFARLDRAETDRRPAGLIKLVVGRGGRILGAGIVGENADETANLLSFALARGATLRQFAGFVSPYPTLGEIGKRAATAYYAPLAGSPFIRAGVAFLARFG